MTRSESPLARGLGGWLLPIALLVAGTALVWEGNNLMHDATARYDLALSRDCQGVGCAPIGTLGQQPGYETALAVTVVGVLVLAVGIFFGARRAGWIGVRPNPSGREPGR